MLKMKPYVLTDNIGLKGEKISNRILKVGTIYYKIHQLSYIKTKNLCTLNTYISNINRK